MATWEGGSFVTGTVLCVGAKCLASAHQMPSCITCHPVVTTKISHTLPMSLCGREQVAPGREQLRKGDQGILRPAKRKP